MRLVALAAAGFLGFALMGWLLGHPVTIGGLRHHDSETRAEQRRRWLRQAGAATTARQFYGVSAAASAAAFGLLYVLTDTWTVALVPALLGGLAPHAYYSRQRKQRLAAVNRAWPDGLRDLTAAATHLTLHQSILALARSGPAPLRNAFAAYPTTSRVLGSVAALEHIKEELADPTSDRVLEVLIVAQDRGTGGELLRHILADLAASFTADLRTEEEINTARLEPKISMATAATVPWLLLVATTLADSPQRAYYTSGRGLVPIMVSAALTVAGVMCVRLLARDPVESRLFVVDENPPRGARQPVAASGSLGVVASGSLASIDTDAVLPALLVGAAGAVLLRLVWQPTPRLAPLLRPYNSANRVRLGRPADLDAPAISPPGAATALFHPMLTSAGHALSRLVDRESDQELLQRLRQAHHYQDLPEDERLLAYRNRRVGFTAAAAALGVLPGLLAGSGKMVAVGLLAGGAFGAVLPRAMVNSDIERRRAQMTIDLYTVNQHLAMLLMTGLGVEAALQRIIRRGRGPIIAELAEATLWARAGMPLHEALEALAGRTPEPHAARTYMALAKAKDHGASTTVAQALLALSDDVRHSRRDALKQLAIKRRHLMYAPIIVLLVPPLLILLGAPLAAQLFGQLI